MQRQRDGVVRTFLEIGVRLTKDLEIEPVLLEIVERSLELTQARYGAALTLDADGGIDSFLHRGLTEQEVALLPHLPRGRGLLGAVLGGRASIRVDRISDHPESVGFPTDHVPMEAFLGVPLLERDQLVGALFLTKPPSEPPFTREDEELVTALGSLAAVGILNARLFAAETERAERSAVLQRLSSRVRRSLDTAEVLSATVEELGRSAGVQRCFIRLSQSDPHRLGPVEFEWDEPGTVPLTGDPEKQYPVASLAAVTRITQWSADVATDERLTDPRLNGNPQDLLDLGTRAALAAPLAWGDRLLGVVVFHCSEPRAWSDADIEFIEGAAGEVAVALHHASLYAQALQTADELAKVDELRREFVSMVSHELRSPMTVVAGISDLLQKRGGELEEGDRSEMIDTLGREARRLSRLVTEVLDLEAIDQGGTALQPLELDIAEVAREAIADTVQRERVAVDVEARDTVVVADRDRIKQVMINLLSNAAKFSPVDAPIGITVTEQDQSVQVSVTDRGPGISSDVVDRLFQRFSRLEETSAGTSGSGLGLYLSKVFVEAHGGEIWVDSEPGRGSTFSFRLPRRTVDEHAKRGAGL